MTLVCVTGMHRSGTSFAAGAIEQLGVSFGDPALMLPPGPDNPRGYWENRLFKELADEVLATFEGTWDQPPVLDEGWEHDARLDPLRERAREAVARTFGEAVHTDHLLGFKDPRACLLLPFWRTVTDLGPTVVVIRDPREVVASLERRNGMDPASSALLWLRYLLAVVRDARNALVLSHRELVENLPGALDRIAHHVGLPLPGSEQVRAIAAESFDAALRHHRADEVEQPDNPIVALACEVWDGGAISIEPLPTAVREALRSGWLRPPQDAEMLARARAKVVRLETTIRRRSLQKAKLDAQRASDPKGTPEDSTSP